MKKFHLISHSLHRYFFPSISSGGGISLDLSMREKKFWKKRRRKLSHLRCMRYLIEFNQIERIFSNDYVDDDNDDDDDDILLTLFFFLFLALMMDHSTDFLKCTIFFLCFFSWKPTNHTCLTFSSSIQSLSIFEIHFY